MAFDRSFLLALLLLVVGSGFLKGNISAQVGALYPQDEEARRTRGFAIFSMAINFGAVAGPLLCGWLAQAYGWHYGFGVAAVFMLAGLATYLAGYRHLPARVERRSRQHSQLTPADWRIIAALVGVIAITIFQSVSYYQLANVLPVWMQDHVALDAGGFRIPVPWYQSIDPLFSILAVPVLFWLWARQALRGREPNDLGKIGIGAWLAAASNLFLVVPILVADGAAVHPVWPFLYCAGMGVAFLHYWPTLLALVSRTAPAQVNATMMGVAFMSLFVSNNLIGWIGTHYERMTPAEFWTLHAAIGATGGMLVLVFGRRLTRALAGAAGQPLRPSAQTLEVER
jgi:POT family proton-dependent oligopeptide transporter